MDRISTIVSILSVSECEQPMISACVSGGGGNASKAEEKVCEFVVWLNNVCMGRHNMYVPLEEVMSPGVFHHFIDYRRWF